MSGSAGTDVLKEYLVKLTYQVNAASQAGFVKSLMEAGTSSSSAASAMYRLGLAIVNMAHNMAEAADKLYYMGQRLQTSVQGIESATYAMTQLGASASDASSAFEGLGSFVRQNGPAATNYLRSLGVTATDSAERLAQLGARLRASGMRPGQEGTRAYTLGLATAAAVGVNENTARAITSDDYAKRKKEADDMARSAGLNMGAYAEGGTKLMQVWRQFGLLFDTIQKKFAQGIFPGLIEQFTRIYNVIRAHLKEITSIFETVGKVIVATVRIFADLVELLGKVSPEVYELGAALMALLGVFKVLSLGIMATPIGWIIAGLTLLMLLLDDYMTWARGGQSAINWGGFGKELMDQVLKLRDAFNDWMCQVFGIKDAWGQIVACVTWLNSFTPKDVWDATVRKFKEWSEYLQQIYDYLKNKIPFIDVDPKNKGSDQRDTIPPGTPGYKPASYETGGGGVAGGGFMEGGSGARPSGQELMAYLQSNQGGGWSVTQAAGIVGNLMQESGLNPNASNDIGGGHYGMAQWGPSRQKAFQERYGKPIQQASWREQIDFLNSELGSGGGESTAGDRLRGSTSVEEATLSVLSAERPGGWNTNPAELMNRLPFARRAMLPGSVAGQPVRPAEQTASIGGRGGVNMNQTTTIQVAAGPTAAETARRVHGAQGRVNEAMVRNVRSVLT